MTPDELAKTGTEHAEQKALFAWCNCAAMYGFDAADDNRFYNAKTRPDIFSTHEIPTLRYLFAIHNQGHGDAIRGARARAEGVKAGVPDLMLPVPVFVSNELRYLGLFIELKKRKGGVVSSEQKDWLNFLEVSGYYPIVCHGWREAADTIKLYLNGFSC